MKCPHKARGVCQVVKQLSGGVEFKPPEIACEKCSISDPPMSENCVTLGLATAAIRAAGGDHKQAMSDLRNRCYQGGQRPTVPEQGPGTELQKLLDWFAKPTEKCNCKQKAAKMNRWGVDGCRKHIDTIVGWLVDELNNRGFLARLVPRPAVRTVVTLAIDRAAGKEPGQPNAVEQLDQELERVDAKRWKENDDLLKDWPFVWTYYGADAVGDELRYSIRSVLRWQPNASIVVIGDRPDWYTGRFIEKRRLSRRPHHAFKDCYSKILRSAKLFDRFVWMMDDVYWTQPFWLSEAITPKYVRHVTQQRYHAWVPKNKWARTRQAAYQWLIDHNRPTYDFAAHLPQPVESVSLFRMESELRLLEQYKNWECVYFNAYFGPGNAMDWGRRFTRVTKPREQVSTSHKVLNHTHSAYAGGVEKYLESLFPDKSRVEI